MRICGIQKLSLLDFPEKTAATVFTGGCNLRCPFCHNAALVSGEQVAPELSQEEFFAFLEKRRGKLDGVCVSGGEPLIQPGLEEFVGRVKALGFLTKLDTNGCYPERLRAIIEGGLVDYVAMDIKNSPAKYALTVGGSDFDFAPIRESIEILKRGDVQYEFRTTAAKGLHEAGDFEEIGKLVSEGARFYIQNFSDSGNLLGFPSDFADNAPKVPRLLPFSPEELEEFTKILRKYVNFAAIRA
jgi:pyruvate formate lyase activating enzyme